MFASKFFGVNTSRFLQRLMCAASIACCLSPVYAENLSIEQFMAALPARYISGLEPERVDTHRIKIFSGSATDAQNRRMASMPNDLMLDILNLGVNGLDQGQPEVGQDYFVYLLQNKNADIAAVISAAKIYGDVKVPDGYKLFRKLPWGFVYTDKGIPAFHLSYWPKPLTRFTESGIKPAWAVLLNGDQDTYTAIDFKKFVPDNARMVNILCVYEPDEKKLGEAYISSNKKDGVLLGRSVGAGATVMTVDQRVTSARQLFYKVSRGKLSIYILGYSQTEPS